MPICLGVLRSMSFALQMMLLLKMSSVLPAAKIQRIRKPVLMQRIIISSTSTAQLLVQPVDASIQTLLYNFSILLLLR
jgi:hypothetical protein